MVTDAWSLLNDEAKVVIACTTNSDSNNDTNETVKHVSSEWKMLLLGTDGIWDCVSGKKLLNMIDNYLSREPSKQTDDMLYDKMVDLMVELQGMTTKVPDILDKLTGKYYGDNCTLMIVFNNDFIKSDN